MERGPLNESSFHSCSLDIEAGYREAEQCSPTDGVVIVNEDHVIAGLEVATEEFPCCEVHSASFLGTVTD